MDQSVRQTSKSVGGSGGTRSTCAAGNRLRLLQQRDIDIYENSPRFRTNQELDAGRGDKNGVGILVDMELRELVVEVRRVTDRLMAIKLVVGGFALNVISTYAPHVGLDEENKRRFWKDLVELFRGIPHTEKLFI
nr:craniofacial development protein 2-like [Nicotiana tomentosiformis]